MALRHHLLLHTVWQSDAIITSGGVPAPDVRCTAVPIVFMSMHFHCHLAAHIAANRFSIRNHKPASAHSARAVRRSSNQMQEHMTDGSWSDTPNSLTRFK